LKFISSKNKNLKCLKDGTELKALNDSYFLSGVKIEACPTCNGFWFNSGEFSISRDNRFVKIDFFKKSESKKRRIVS